MSSIKYGEILDPSIDLGKVNAYNFFSTYFNNPILVKIKELEGLAMFGTRVASSLLRDRKYIFALVDLSDPSSKLPQASLSELNWTFLQTRSLSDVYSVPTYRYSVPKECENIEINLIDKNATKTMYHYRCKMFPNVNITLLTNKNQYREYSERGTLNLAIESYNCMISLQ